MKRNAVQILRIRLNPERNHWDRAIVDWLKTLPFGYRSKILKETIVRALGKDGSADTVPAPVKKAPDIQSRLRQMFDK